jgi:5-methylcytosine-specific restriction protein A
LKQARFDALVLGWKKNRDLLIEAKTDSEGVAGRSQVRQAIGQLYDYRLTYMPNNNVDLAVLLPREPSKDVRDLLSSLHIELLWFRGKSLMGTIEL